MTIDFPHQRSCNNDDDSKLEAKKKDIAALLSNHVQPNEPTVVTLSDATGKKVKLKTPAADANELLRTAMALFS